MKWEGDREEVIVDMSRPSSWGVGGGSAGGGAPPVAVMVVVAGAASRVEGAGDIEGSSFWMLEFGVGGNPSRLWMRFVKKPENRFPARFF